MALTQVSGMTPRPVEDTANLTTTLWEKAASSASREILFSSADGTTWQGTTWGQLADRVRSAAAGLIAMGIEKGDRVALMSGTRIEWTVADLAILAAGAVTVPIYETSSVGQCEWILSDSGAKVAFAGSADHAKTLDGARGQAPDLAEVFVLDDGGLDALAERGGEKGRAAVEQRVAATGLADLASLIYTSGTTGNPKGCILSHGNLLVTARQSGVNLEKLFQAGDSTLLFLPLAHVFARIIQFGCMENDVQVAYARSVETLVADLQSFKPTFLLSVPRVFEKVFNTAQRGAEGLKRPIFDFAVATSREWAGSNKPGLLTNVKRTLADRLVYSRLRAALGGRVRYCVSGGAPLSAHLAHFFHAAGITILEGYGLTETSAATTCNTPDAMRIGTVGRPGPGVDMRVALDGELLVRSAGVFAGYYQNEEATRDAIDADGWFHTGDLGEIDDDGYVKITGRKKEIIVTAGGKNVAPAVLEERLKSHRLVSQAMVVGDNRPFIGALVTLEPEELAAFAKERGLSGASGPGAVAQLAKEQAVLDELDKAVAHANDAVSKAESIRKIAVLDRDFDAEHDEITPTLKLKRKVVVDHFSEQIEGLYRK